MKLYSSLVFALIFLTQPPHSFGWGATGHRIIAEIAEKHLTRKAKKNIHKIIGHQKLAYWSNWADFIKSDTSAAFRKTHAWHYVNIPADLSHSEFLQVLDQSPEENLYKAYGRLRAEAKSGAAPLEVKRQQLYFILHLLADAHQPLHVGREVDKGGNLISVTYFGRKTNIHAVWDSDLIDGEKYSYSEYVRVLDIDKTNYAKYTNSEIEDWIYESHQLANDIYKDVADNATLSYGYMYKFKDVLERRLLEAGLRLAKELNEIYG